MEDRIRTELPIELDKKVIRISIQYPGKSIHPRLVHSLIINRSNFRDWSSTARDILRLDHQVLLLLLLHQQLPLWQTEINLELRVIKRIFCPLMSMEVVDQQIFLKVILTNTEFQKVNNVISTQIDLNMEVFKT